MNLEKDISAEAEEDLCGRDSFKYNDNVVDIGRVKRELFQKDVLRDLSSNISVFVIQELKLVK